MGRRGETNPCVLFRPPDHNVIKAGLCQDHDALPVAGRLPGLQTLHKTLGEED
jgi:hypothetical protein